MFNFGKNWQAYSLNALDETALLAAQQSISHLLEIDNLEGQTLLDLGCGSGLFSVAAAKLGAQVIAADINPLCLDITQQNVNHFLSDPEQVRTIQLSALDAQSMRAYCESFDVVYSWGVLHHTGDMWQAIENTLEMVKPKGQLVLGIYNRHVTSAFWKAIKWTYIHSPAWGQQVLAIVFASVIFVAKLLVTRQNPLKKERGMTFWYDVIDWVGGYPYQYASADEIVQFVQARGFSTRQVIPASVPTGCNEFVFLRSK